MGRYDGILFCTDLDGTLLKNDCSVSRENIAAIEYFKENGGIFTFVTGRMPFFVSEIWNTLRPNAAFGCINGGGLYDFEKQKYISQCVIPETVLELVQCVDEAVPGVGIQVNTFYHTYFCKENDTMVRFREITGLPNLARPYQSVDEPMAKILFGTDDESEMEALQQVLRAHPKAEKFDFIRSAKYLYEILPKGIGKGTVISELPKYLDRPINKTVAIGDYNNDISMIQAADLGIAVANACPEALAAADMVTVSNEEHAIAKVIESL